MSPRPDPAYPREACPRANGSGSFPEAVVSLGGGGSQLAFGCSKGYLQLRLPRALCGEGGRMQPRIGRKNLSGKYFFIPKLWSNLIYNKMSRHDGRSKHFHARIPSYFK